MTDKGWTRCAFYGYDKAMKIYPKGRPKMAADGRRASEARCKITL